MVRLPRKFPFGGVDRRVPRHGRGITRAGRYGGLDGDVAVSTEAEHAFPGPADSRQEDRQKESPCDDCRFSKTPHAAILASNTFKKSASLFRATCNDANGKAKFYRPHESALHSLCRQEQPFKRRKRTVSDYLGPEKRNGRCFMEHCEFLRLFVPVALKPSGNRTYPIGNFKGLRIDT